MSSRLVSRVKSINDLYEEIEALGDGTYGIVKKMRDRKSSQIVAVKEIKHHQGCQETDLKHTMREVTILSELRHVNIIKLLKVVQTCDDDEKLYFVFEYCPYDLQALVLKENLSILDDFIKSMAMQLLVAIKYCAVKNVIHRDLKPANIFVTEDNIMKLGDFGLARKGITCTWKIKHYTSKVITLWYRPPELLMGYNRYGCEVDMWSVGCILFEMATGGEVLFKTSRQTEIDQLNTICEIRGNIPRNWSIYSRLKNAEKFLNLSKVDRKDRLLKHLNQRIPDFSHKQEFVKLIAGMLEYEPDKRITAENALNSEFFKFYKDKMNPLKLEKSHWPEIHQRDLKVGIKNKEKKIPRDITDLHPPKQLPPDF